MDLNHLHLHVRDLGASCEWYGRYFGFREKWRDGDILFIENDSRFDLALVRAAALDSFPAWFHFGFRLETKEEVEAKFREMPIEAILQPLEDEGEGKLISFRITDPDGYKIEVYWE